MNPAPPVTRIRLDIGMRAVTERRHFEGTLFAILVRQDRLMSPKGRGNIEARNTHSQARRIGANLVARPPYSAQVRRNLPRRPVDEVGLYWWRIENGTYLCGAERTGCLGQSSLSCRYVGELVRCMFT